MYSFEINFYPQSFDSKFLDDFDWWQGCFMAALANNGQILYSFINSVKYSNHYTCRVVVPEMDSLDEKYYNDSCKNMLHFVNERSVKPPDSSFIGENSHITNGCICKNSSHYVLYTFYLGEQSPVICGDCLKGVAIYKLPNDSELRYFSWKWLHQACDRQFMNGIGERHGYKMMNDPKSALSQEGLEICANLEALVKKPVYYFLFKYYTKNKASCPKCGADWINYDNKFHYGYVCHNCRLASEDCGIS
ncbi:MAG: Zn-ribbon-containing protein [Deferribacteraceae bacterium]|jgi:predicted  nucleic acid-binding Zn ribbon protein|nr:Zn-ribbon-containing protein [Deferribacteraceae bacterium]